MNFNRPTLPLKLTDMLWIKSYCGEISENITKFVTECIFVGDTIKKERRGKQTIAFLAVSWFTVC